MHWREEHIKEIVDIMLVNVKERLQAQDIAIEVTEDAKDVLVDEGFDVTYGARPLRRTIQRMLEDRLSDEILAGNVEPGDKAIVGAQDSKLTFKSE